MPRFAVTPLTSIALLIGAATASAATWDIAPGGTTPPTGDGTVTGGTGTWDLTSYNWTADGGATNLRWTNGADASFGDVGGTITVGEAVTAYSITLAPTSGAYTLYLRNTLTNTTTLRLGPDTKLGFLGNQAAAKYVGNIALNGGVLYTGSGNTATVNGLFSGNGDLTMNHAAVSYGNTLNQTMANLANTYTGNTVLVNNILQFNGYNTTDFNPFGADTGSTVSIASHNQWSSYNGAGVIFNPSATGSTYTVTQNLALSASNGTKAFVKNIDGTLRLTGGVSATTDGNASSRVVFTGQYGGKDFYLDGVLSGTGNVTVSSAGGAYGSGTVFLTNNANTYTGTITVDATEGRLGILGLVGDTAAQSAKIALANGGRLRVETASAVVASLNGTSTTSTVVTTSATVNSLRIDNAADNAFAGTIGVTGSYYINDNGTQAATTNAANIAIVKSGAGKLTLTGTNAYVGGTTVSAGTLITGNGAALGTGSVTVNGGVLQIGDGIATTVALGSGANLVIAGGTLKLDATLGTATTAITLSGGGKYTFAGTLDLSGVFNLAGAGSYTLIGGGTGNTDTSVTLAGYANAGYNAVFSNGTLILTAVPEPSVYGLLGTSALAGLAILRRRHR